MTTSKQTHVCTAHLAKADIQAMDVSGMSRKHVEREVQSRMLRCRLGGSFPNASKRWRGNRGLCRETETLHVQLHDATTLTTASLHARVQS